jgi:hypothetical protein
MAHSSHSPVPRPDPARQPEPELEDLSIADGQHARGADPTGGKSSPGEFVITKKLDKSSPKLYQ